MPLIDMPLSELKIYKGAMTKPKDFDTFWDDALASLDSIDLDLSIKEADFQVPFARCYDVYYNGTDGARIYAKMVKPMTLQEKVPVVLRFHGYTGDSGDWTGLLNYAAAGMIALAMDCRGQGGKSTDYSQVKGGTLYGFIMKGVDSGKDALYFKHVFLDTVLLARIALNMDEVDSNRLYACGASQGGALTLACASLEPRVSKLVPAYPFLCDYRRVWDLDLAKDAYIGLREYFRHFDPRHEREDEFFNTLSYIDLQFLASRIQGEVLMATGLMDTICPPSTQFAAYNKIKSPKKMDIYPDFAHERLPGHNDRELAFLLS
jgi:cephalosporin-C deacetylase